MANNPHAETYQGKTQFSGPVMAGTRWNGANAAYVGKPPQTYPIAVSKLANAGYVVCSQSCAVDQTLLETVTDIRLPAGSMTIAMQVIVTDPWTGTNKGYKAVVNSAASQHSMTDYTDLTTVGVYNFGPGDETNRPKRWKNINYDADRLGESILSVDIYDQSEEAGTGRGILTLSYIPGLGL